MTPKKQAAADLAAQMAAARAETPDVDHTHPAMPAPVGAWGRRRDGGAWHALPTMGASVAAYCGRTGPDGEWLEVLDKPADGDDTCADCIARVSSS